MSPPLKIARIRSRSSAGAGLGFDHLLQLCAEQIAGPAEMRLEDLTDVHAARNAQRVQNDVDRLSVRKVRHVLFGKNPADDALVAVATGHLVADLKLALDGDVDLHHLDDARRKLVALAELVDLLLEQHLDGIDLIVDLLENRVGLLLVLVDLDVSPVLVRDRDRDPRW